MLHIRTADKKIYDASQHIRQSNCYWLCYSHVRICTRSVCLSNRATVTLFISSLHTHIPPSSPFPQLLQPPQSKHTVHTTMGTHSTLFKLQNRVLLPQQWLSKPLEGSRRENSTMRWCHTTHQTYSTYSYGTYMFTHTYIHTDTRFRLLAI